MGSEYKELTYKESLEKFSLKENYTEEELKRNYRELMRKKHPDLYINKSKEEQTKAEYEAKQINEAYDKLLKKLRGEYVIFPNERTYKSYQRKNFNVNNYYKNIIVRKMHVYMENTSELEELFSSFKLKISDLKSLNIYIQKHCKTNREIDDKFKEFTNKVIEINRYIKEIIFKDNYVNEKELNCTINYDKPIKVFYDEINLIAMSNKNKKETDFKKQLEEEMKSYEYYAYYNDIQGLITKLLEKFLQKAENKKFKNLDNLIVEFNTCILEEFDKCARIMTLINEQINNGNLSELKLKKLKDIIKNYSKYGFTKSIEIINMTDEELEEDTSYVKKTILIKNSGKEEGPFYILQIEVNEKTDFYYIDWNLNCCLIENNNYSIEFISNNYITLKEFVEHSLYIGKIGYKQYIRSNKVELLCVNKNIVLVHIDGDEKIIVDNMNDYIITDERTQFRTYEELENELINMFKNVKIYSKEYKKSKK